MPIVRLSSIVTSKVGPFKYSSVQIEVPLKSPAYGFIDPQDFYEPEGGAEDEPHVTVLYGLLTEDTNEVQDIIAGTNPVSYTLRETVLFEKKDYDVVVIRVESVGIVRLHNLLTASLEFESDYDDYKPHMTVAYVNKGSGEKYAGLEIPLSGIKLRSDFVTFKPKSGIGGQKIIL